MALVLPLDVRAAQLVDAVQKLLSDESRWVRAAAFMMLGPLLALLGAEAAPKLLHFFVDAALSPNRAQFGDISIV